MPDPYRFRTLGPFRVPFEARTRTIDMLAARDSVFEKAQEQASRRGIDNICDAVGLYVFGLSPSGNIRTWPYYVGQACKQTLYQRVFQKTDKPGVYNDIMAEYVKAAPFVYLLPLVTKSGRLARLGANASIINDAEQMLIGLALAANYSLWNIKHRAAMERFTIDGTPQAGGKDSHAAGSFRRMLNLERRKDPAKPAEPKAGALPLPDISEANALFEEPVPATIAGELG